MIFFYGRQKQYVVAEIFFSSVISKSQSVSPVDCLIVYKILFYFHENDVDARLNIADSWGFSLPDLITSAQISARCPQAERCTWDRPPDPSGLPYKGQRWPGVTAATLSKQLSLRITQEELQTGNTSESQCADKVKVKRYKQKQCVILWAFKNCINEWKIWIMKKG